MIDELTKITNDLEYIIDNFSPVLNELQKNQSSPIFLSSFSNLKNLNNVSNWVITLLKANLYNGKVTQVLKYNEKHGILQFYIILDEGLFEDARETKELKNIIIVHEFIHFLALFYASISSSENNFHQILIERLSQTSNATPNENIFKLHKFLTEGNLIDDSYSYEQVNDAHFRIGIEKMPLDYAELFRNFLLSRQMLDKYFSHEKRNIFFNLFKEHKNEEAQDLLNEIINKTAKEEFLPITFVANQTIDLIIKYYSDKYI
ncbi:hypothetical protein [Treponema sp. R6D11]